MIVIPRPLKNHLTRGSTQENMIVTKRPIDANINWVYLLGFEELSFNILETRK